MSKIHKAAMDERLCAGRNVFICPDNSHSMWPAGELKHSPADRLLVTHRGGNSGQHAAQASHPVPHLAVGVALI